MGQMSINPFGISLKSKNNNFHNNYNARTTFERIPEFRVNKVIRNLDVNTYFKYLFIADVFCFVGFCSKTSALRSNSACLSAKLQ